MAVENYTDMVKNTSWLLSANMVSRILTAVFIILLANHLLPADFGVYNFAFSTAFIVSVIPEFGFDALTVKKVSKKPSKAPEMIADVLSLRIIFSILTVSLLWFFSTIIIYQFGMDIQFNILLLAFLTLLFEKISGGFFAVFRAKGKMNYQAYVIISWKIIYLFLGILGILLGFGLFKILLLLLTASIFQSILSITFYFTNLEHSISLPNIQRWKTLIYSAYPFAVFSILSMFYGHITIVLISILKGPSPTGLFSAGWKLIIFLGVIPHSFGRALFPFFTKLYSSKPDSVKEACVRSTRNLLQTAIPLTVILYLLTPEIIDILFTRSYLPTVKVFRILIWMIPFLFVNGSLRMVLWSTDRTIETSKNLLYSSLSLLIFGALLIYEFGILGAAASVVSAEIIYFITNYIKIRRTLGAIWNKDFLTISIITIISIYMMYFVQNNNLFSKYVFIILFIPIYITTLYKLKALKKEDIYAIKSSIPFFDR
ncbi:MAG: oligosaccharide flippase family protein [Thermoplasmatota archaeon]